MRSLIFGTVVLLALLVSLPASAQHYDHRWTSNSHYNHPQYYGSQRHNHRHHYGHRHHRSRNNHPQYYGSRRHNHRHHYGHRHHRSRNSYRSSDVAIALGAGLLIGSAIDRSRQPQVVHHYPVQPVYDQPYYRPQQHRCRIREIRTYDMYGRLIGVRTVCQ